MAAPVGVLHTHVHSFRLASGAEALAARVLTKDGAGLGFSLGMDAAVARDMAAWDAYAKEKKQPLWALLGGKPREVPVAKDEDPAFAPDWEKLRRALLVKSYRLVRIDPFAWGSVEMVQNVRAGADALKIPVALLAPNAHRWEISWCAALAGESGRVIVRREPHSASQPLSDAPGSGIDWSREPAFTAIRWQEPR